MRKFERYVAEERFIQLAADAIQRRHPQADWLAVKGVLPVALSDAALEAANQRLGDWLSEHMGHE